MQTEKLDGVRIRTMRLALSRENRWTIALIEPRTYSPHKRLGVEIRERGKLVYASWGFGPSPMHAEDSLESMLSACALACYDATHDEDDKRIDCAWDAEGCDTARAYRLEALRRSGKRKRLLAILDR